MKKVAVILSGCGVYDGSEIHEAVLTLLRGAGATAWVRIDGIASAQDIIGEYRKLAANDQ